MSVQTRERFINRTIATLLLAMTLASLVGAFQMFINTSVVVMGYPSGDCIDVLYTTEYSCENMPTKFEIQYYVEAK